MKFNKIQLRWFLLALFLGGNHLMAQGGEVAPKAVSRFAGLADLTAPQIAVAVLCLMVLFFGWLSMWQLFNTLIHAQKVRLLEKYQPELLEQVGVEVPQIQTESWWRRQYKRWTQVVPLDREKDIMLDHDYDGIKELDNRLPPWWVATFYVSIAFGLVYMYFAHFSDWGKSSAEWYEIEMVEAEQAVKEYLALQADAVDETNVVLLAGDSELENGRMIYQSRCATCHGQFGEGGIGPNMTDNYWLHGQGDIASVFTTVKYGVPQKGMIAWKAELRPRQIQEVSSFIVEKLVGTDPPNPKEPQGDLVEATEDTLVVQETTEVDSTQTLK